MKLPRGRSLVKLTALVAGATTGVGSGLEVCGDAAAASRESGTAMRTTSAMVCNAGQLITNAEAAIVLGGNASSINRRVEMGGHICDLVGPHGRLLIMVPAAASYQDAVRQQPRFFHPVGGIGDKAVWGVTSERVDLIVLKRGVTVRFSLQGTGRPAASGAMSALKALARKAVSRVPAGWGLAIHHQSQVAMRVRKPEPAIAGVPADALVTAAEAATVLGSQSAGRAMPGRGGSTNVCIYSTERGILTVAVHQSFPATFDPHRPNPQFIVEKFTGIGDKAIMYISKRARAEGRTEIRLFVLKGKIQLDLILHNFGSGSYPATPNALKALGRKAISRFR